MNRRGFLGRLSAVIAGALAAPSITLPVVPTIAPPISPMIAELNAVTLATTNHAAIIDNFFKATPMLEYLKSHSVIAIDGGVEIRR